MGYVKGILERLDAIEREEPGCTAVLAGLRQRARRFQLNEFNTLLKAAGSPTPRVDLARDQTGGAHAQLEP